MRRGRRQVEQAKAYDSAGLSFKLPVDSVGILKIFVFLLGYVAVTITSGTPVAKQGSLLNSMFSTFIVKRGSVVYKAASPEFFRFFNGAVEKIFPELRATGSATASSYPTADLTGYSSAPYGTTGQNQNMYEAVCIYCEMPYLPHAHSGRLKTALQTKGRGEHTLELRAAATGLANILGYGNTAVIAYGASTNLLIQVEVEEIVEDFEGEITNNKDWQNRMAFYQIESPQALTASMNRSRLSKLGAQGGLLAGLTMICRDNAAGSATTSTGKIRNDEIPTDFEVRINGVQSLAETNWKRAKSALRRAWGYNSPITSNTSEDTGISGVRFCHGSVNEFKAVPSDGNLEVIITTAAQATASDYNGGTAELKVILDYLDAA